jgi:hypothetical protein
MFMNWVQKIVRALSVRRLSYALFVWNALLLLFFCLGSNTSNNLLAGNGLVRLSLMSFWVLVLLQVLLLLNQFKEILFYHARGWAVLAQVLLVIASIAFSFHILPVVNVLLQAIRGNWSFGDAGYETLSRMSSIPRTFWILGFESFLIAVLAFIAPTSTKTQAKKRKAA